MQIMAMDPTKEVSCPTHTPASMGLISGKAFLTWGRKHVFERLPDDSCREIVGHCRYWLIGNAVPNYWRSNTPRVPRAKDLAIC